jgi:hypothetical protein
VICASAIYFFVGLPLRLVEAILFNSVSPIDLYILLEAPFNEDLLRLPLFAANAAPAAICCFLDFAGMMLSFQALSQPEPIEGV